MFYSLYEELRNWQAAIAALVGFGGLISAALFNAHLMRKRDDRLREQDTKAVARALVSEAAAITAFVSARATRIRSIIEEKQRTQLPDEISFDVDSLLDAMALPTPRVYERCMERIGHMPPETAMALFKFYEHLTVANRRVSEICSFSSHKFGISNMESILDWYDGVMRRGGEAITQLNSYLRN